MRALSISTVICTLAMLGLVVQAQREPGVTVAGQILDNSGGPVVSAAVRLMSGELTIRSTTTDSGGRFAFQRVPPAEYVLVVSRSSYVTLRHPLTVRAGDAAPASVTLTLQAGSAPERPAVREPGRADQARAQAAARAAGRSEATAVPHVPSPTAPPPPASPMTVVRPGPYSRYPSPGVNTESYARIDDNDLKSTMDAPLSTFSIDVDTASYANVRRFLTSGTLPPVDAVRIEEMINYFRFDYPRPTASAPFSVVTEVGAAPWNPRHRLALIGLQARPVDADVRLRRNLVFLLDVSGSMMPPDKLPLIRKSMSMLVDTLTSEDRIAIVVYAGASGLVLPTTPGHRKDLIRQAIDGLEAGGSTNGGAGITLAYTVARQQFITGGINRVILATDGDFNVGVTSQGELMRLIEQQRQAGVFLSVLGVGTGNLKDSTMEMLADRGNGNYSYLDSLHEARRVLVTEAGGTLVTVAKDVKIQVEFNPAQVAAYRLIGYENRLLRDRDFNDDRKDAGEIGAGHTVTALYEIVPAGVTLDRPQVDPLRYGAPAPRPEPAGTFSNELMTVKLRYKKPDGDVSKLLTHPVSAREQSIGDNLGFAAAVAEFGMLLRRSDHKGSATFRSAAALARRHRGRDDSGYRAELIRLIDLAEALTAATTDDVGGEWQRRR